MKELSDAERTPEISMEEHDKGEREMNAHAGALLRMMGLSEEVEGDRLRRAMHAEGTGLAPFYGLRKDHKELQPGEESSGPKMRPGCGAKDCSTKRTSYVLCQILDKVVPKGGTQCESTDDLLAEFEKVNKERDADKNWVIGSLDVVALYPSLNVERCAKVVREALFESELEFKNLQWKEIALYLRYHLGHREIMAEGLGWICPRRRNDRRPPMFEASGSDRDKKKRYDPWIFSRREPDDRTVRRMFCIAIEVMIKRTMSLHDFKLDEKVFRQREGGSIGLDLTGVVSDIFMSYWDKKLLDGMAENELGVIV